MTSFITSRSGSPPPLRMSPNSQPDQNPAEQPAAPPKGADKQALSNPPVRSGQEQQRFLALHGKDKGKASVEDGASSNAATENDKLPQSDHSHAAKQHVAESSSVRRRAPRVQKGDLPGPVQEPSRSPQGGERNASTQNPIARKFNLALKAFVIVLALSAGFRFKRNPRDFPSSLAKIPGDFARGPVRTLLGLTNFFHDRVNEGILQAGQQAVLEKFGSYIPADAPCYQVHVEVSPNLPLPSFGEYDREKNSLAFAAYQQPLDSAHYAAHEYCHCFTHPKFYEAIDESPNRRELRESLTEHITNKVNKAMFSSNYALENLSNGKKMTEAAQELEDAVGEATLMRAYFGGDEEAIRKVSRAAVDIFPKSVTLAAWDAIEKVDKNYRQQLWELENTKLNTAEAEFNKAFWSSKDVEAVTKAEQSLTEARETYERVKSKFDTGCRQQLAECLVGASLLSKGKLPAYINNYDEHHSYIFYHLPVSDFSEIDAKQKKEIKQQAKQARERLGAKFDQAFYNFDEKAAEEAMTALCEDLLTNWKPILRKKNSLF